MGKCHRADDHAAAALSLFRSHLRNPIVPAINPTTISIGTATVVRTSLHMHVPQNITILCLNIFECYVCHQYIARHQYNCLSSMYSGVAFSTSTACKLCRCSSRAACTSSSGYCISKVCRICLQVLTWKS